MIDRFVSGVASRISPESPVPVLLIDNENVVIGGAGNVARNISALGGTVKLIGVAGKDEGGAVLRGALAGVDRLRSEIIYSNDRRTTVKTRFVAQGQHMLRADIEDVAPIDAELESEFLAVIRESMPGYDILVLSDYAKGVLTDAVVAGAIRCAKELGRDIVVDPKCSRLSKYRGATVLTPNAIETFEATRVDVLAGEAEAERAGRAIIREADVGAVLITRAHKGISCVTSDAPAVHLQAGAREVFDVVGAGDTVVAALALALGAGDMLVSAARIANAAAGLVVGKHGTATISASELEDELTRLAQGESAVLEEKVVSRDVVLSRAARWRRDGQSIGFTNGCFDLLHIGHLSLLTFARAHCDKLVLGLNSDASVIRLKGPGRPINAEADRAMVLAALSVVDAVVIFDEDTPIELIQDLAPDVLVKGADYAIHEVVGADAVLEKGGRVLTCDIVPGKSSSSIVDSINAR